jgi:hypothetical protein
MQVMVFGLVSSIVERLGDLVNPHASAILSWLPQVWQDSAGQGMLRMQVQSPTHLMLRSAESISAAL